jgi:hypothetical protein
VPRECNILVIYHFNEFISGTRDKIYFVFDNFSCVYRGAVPPVLINYKLAAGSSKRIVRSINFRRFVNTCASAIRKVAIY